MHSGSDVPGMLLWEVRARRPCRFAGQPQCMRRTEEIRYDIMITGAGPPNCEFLIFEGWKFEF
jgi:hypothetical protein